jgi:nitrite reductase/ring-hydroxylating ferredoxin subunit
MKGSDMASIRYLTPENLYARLNDFTSGMAVTKGSFELMVDKCKMQDMEWNHMDQMHRFSIHNTYDKSVRIATGENFAVSLTQWGKWPFLITVSDVYLAKGLFYQSLTLAGIIFLHSIISMEEVEGGVKLKDEWYIASHKLFKFLHKPLNKKLYKLNVRLQQEDEQIRHGRFEARKKAYQFKTDVPDYYNSNLPGNNTIYPVLPEHASFALDDVTHENTIKKLGEIEFIVKKDEVNNYLIWPAVCPHEGGPLIRGKFCETRVTCPWHGLQFQAVQLSAAAPEAARHGFSYLLKDGRVYVMQ